MKQRKRLSWLLPVLIVAFSCNQLQEKNEIDDKTNAAGEAVNQQPSVQVDKNVLAGNWTRTDAEYRIQISMLADDGTMAAGYFNPKSINVAMARWSNNEGSLKIYIELRDENYPGSKYDLAYIPNRNILSGEYYQAVEGKTYKVEFVKTK